MSDRYNKPEYDSDRWDLPLNSNFDDIGDDIDWLMSNVGSSGGGDVSGVDGIDFRGRHVGPLHDGIYHEAANADSTLGVVFEASGLHIDSVVVDAETSGTETIELREYNGGALDPSIVDSTTVSLSGGPQRVSLGFDVPSSGGDANDEYILARGPTTSPISLRRLPESDAGTTLYDQHTYTDPAIDFLHGSATMVDGDFGATDFYYYFFDWVVGTEQDRVTAPWSTDVDEIYMRPRDPEEEFDDVSPRAIWFDTS